MKYQSSANPRLNSAASEYRPPIFEPIQRHSQPILWKPEAPVAMRVGLIVADIIALAISAIAIIKLRTALWGQMPTSGAMIIGAVVWLLLRQDQGLYSVHGMAPPEELRRSTLTTLIAGLVHAAMLFVLHLTQAPRFMSVGMWVLLAILSWTSRQAAKTLLVKRGLFGLPIVIIGAGNTGRLLIRELLGSPSLGLRPVAAFDDDASLHGRAIEGVPVLGDLKAALSAPMKYPISYALIAIPRLGRQRLVNLSHRFASRYTYVGIVPDLLGLASLWVRPRNVGSVLTLEFRHDRFDVTSLRLKRLFDLLFGVPALLLAMPVIAMCAVLVKLVSPGPAFYAQIREGLGGRKIRVWKIRTMVPDAEHKLERHLRSNDVARVQWERSMKLEKDPRVVRGLGSFLRRWSLDELPQLWNVVRGDMSLVGPRPFPDYHLARFPKEFLALRHQVPPGITGFWQVTDRSEADLGRQEAADAYYIHNWSLWLDTWILLRTVHTVVAGVGAY